MRVFILRREATPLVPDETVLVVLEVALVTVGPTMVTTQGPCVRAQYCRRATGTVVSRVIMLVV